MKKIIFALLLGTFSLSANAYDTYVVPEVNPAFQFNVMHRGEYVDIQENEPTTSSFKIPYKYIDPLLRSAANWHEIISSPNPIRPVIYSYLSEDDYNAAAGSPYVNVEGKDYKYTVANAVLHDWNYELPENFTGDAMVFVGLGINEQNPGWQPYTGKHGLYQGELPDLYAVMNHEMMHSLGVSSNASQFFADEDDPTSDQKYYFSEGPTDPISIFDAQLRIYEHDVAPTTVDDLNTYEKTPQPGQAIGEDPGEYDIINNSPYFVGENTIKVLGGNDNYNTARQNIIANGGLVNYSSAYDNDEHPELSVYPIVYGMPIHPADGNEIDLSHLELKNSYMSHQDYRNWLVPMEAELAVMKDIGYDVELRKYFGKSFYLNGNVYAYSEGFSTWDGTAYTGVPSTIDQAVGIHIYGDDNVITQTTKSIETMGEGSFGVRIDGVGNTFTLDDNQHIYANGKENYGIAVTWGKGHTVNVSNGTEVTATGENGIAASFDFGANLFGTKASNVKGSYINFVQGESEYDTGDIIPEVATQGALVSNFNVNGTLEGAKAAIYISDNAHVDNINIGDGATINGDIISEWNSISSEGKANVLSNNGGAWHVINPYADDLYYTNLNFNAPGEVDVNGDISGENHIFNTLKMSNADGSVINFNGNVINVNSLDNNGDLNISQVATITTYEDEITGNGDINVLAGASLNLSPNIETVENTLHFDNASFDLTNNSISSVEIAGMELTGQNTIGLDIDLKTRTSDSYVFNDPDDLTVNDGATLDITNVNLINKNTALTENNKFIPFISADYNNQNLLGNINFNAEQNLLTPIFKYNLGYTEDADQGGFLLTRGAGRNYNNYNPAVVASSVAAQMGGYLSQLNSYEQAFQNMDMKMLMTREERQAYKMANLYASTVTPTVFSPTYLPEKDKAAWFRPYAAFEKIGLKNGPKVESISYGSYFGGDSPVYETKNGWDYQYSVYAGYNGSHQNYSGNSIYQNGGTIGGTAIWYKNDFFTALTANVGAGVAEASTMYGSEDMTMLMSGIASKTGYNWELASGRFIIQPSFLMSYSFVNTFDYTNAAGVRIKSDPLNAINIAPGLKFIGNLKNGWQPYIGMQMVWNIMDKTDFKANNVSLPDMSVKPYFQYGVGIQKRWGERFTGFFQSMLRSGGRNGVALSLGFKWALGK